MNFWKERISRRQLIKSAVAATAAATAVPNLISAGYTPFKSDSLDVWTCGGLSEAFLQINDLYEAKTGHNIQYTGAFAGALGKALLTLKGQTEVFGARGLELAQNMRKKVSASGLNRFVLQIMSLQYRRAIRQAFVTLKICPNRVFGLCCL